MKEGDIARIYARSISEMGEEKGLAVADELTHFQLVINGCNDLENLLFLDIFTSNEKIGVLEKIFEKITLSVFVQRFILFLVEEKRINLLPLIYKEVMVMDDAKKGFIRGTVEGTEENISEEDKRKIEQYLKGKMDQEPKLTYSQRGDLTAGYRITVGDLHLDASVECQFNMLKQSILGD